MVVRLLWACYDSTMAVCYNSNVGGGLGEEGREGGCIIFAFVYSWVFGSESQEGGGVVVLTCVA